jgi:pyruvate/2-oxoglutarate dehydrogenase complex dihydrolipoamide acyltransferase (E2) component
MSKVVLPNGEFSDDGSAANDMRGYGYMVNLLKMATGLLMVCAQALGYRDAAATAATAAAGSVDEAGTRAAAAAGSATTAGTKADAAETARAAAAAAATGAVTARTGAETAQAAAEAAAEAAIGVGINDTGTGIGVTGQARSADYLAKDHTPAVLTSNQTVVAGNGYPMDTTAGALSLTLPAGADGNKFWTEEMSGNAKTNPISLIPNGTNKVCGINDTVTITNPFIRLCFVFKSSINGWVLA